MLSPNLKQQHQSFNLKTHWVLFHGEMLHMVKPFEGDPGRHCLLGVQLPARSHPLAPHSAKSGQGVAPSPARCPAENQQLLADPSPGKFCCNPPGA